MNKDHIYKRRLLKLADFLDKLPPERFNFRRWVGMDWKGRQNLSCGTTACAFGWATTMQVFRKLGLRLMRHPTMGFGLVHLKGETDYERAAEKAAAHVFGLNGDEFDYLFFPVDETGSEMWFKPAPHLDATAKELAEHIRFFVSKKYPD